MFRWLLRLLGIQRPTAQPGLGHPQPAPAPAPEPPAAPRIVLAAMTPAGPPWEDGVGVEGVDTLAATAELKRALAELLDTATDDAERALIELLTRQVERNRLDLPPFPDIAQELDALLRETTTDILQIARVVERDPGLVKRVWAEASGANYDAPPRSLHHAVARAGLDALWRIGMSVCLNNVVFRVKGYQHAADRIRTHGVVVAEVAATLGGERRGPLYMGGLLHDVGRLIVLRAAADIKPRLPGIASVERISNRCHALLGVLVVYSWGLDPAVAGGVGHHHAPEAAPADHRRAATVVQAANVAAHAVAMARSGMSIEDCDPSAVIQDLGFDALQALDRAAAIYDQYEGDTAMPRTG